MSLRFNDHDCTLRLSVRDLVEHSPPSGHLTLEVSQSREARLERGRRMHAQWQAERQAEVAGYEAEATVTLQLTIDDWTVTLKGRVDGLIEEAGGLVVEELKTTALPASRLLATHLDDWVPYREQLELYQWMIHLSGKENPQGRLIFVSLTDGSRHILGTAYDHSRIDRVARTRLHRLIAERKERLQWLQNRKEHPVPPPFEPWRPGQEEISDAVQEALNASEPILVEAPTGLGKTAAMLHGALKHCISTDRQLFWATSRNTQQRGVRETVARFLQRGLPLRSASVIAKEKMCLNDVVACRPDLCPYAEDYYDKLHDGGALNAARSLPSLTPSEAMRLGEAHQVCPFQLTLDAAATADVVIGDTNYAFSPRGRLKRWFGDDPAASWVVIADEFHHLVERARGYGSPSLSLQLLDAASTWLEEQPGVGFAFHELIEDLRDAFTGAISTKSGPEHDDGYLVSLTPEPWTSLASRIDDLAYDYALIRAESTEPAADDPWLRFSRDVVHFAERLSTLDPDTVPIVQRRDGDTRLKLLCLSPHHLLKPQFEALGGIAGCSATLTPSTFFCETLGLPGDTQLHSTGSPFPAERRLVLLAPRVSTLYRDRQTHRPMTAELLSECLSAVPGHCVVYFPSFQMLHDITESLDVGDRLLLRQHPAMSEEDREQWMNSLRQHKKAVVLAAVVGGIFAEGIDLPSGALDGVFIVGPALPPIGLERTLIRDHYQSAYGKGFEYASLIPGMTKVVQAAGRLIRRSSDRGAIVLIGKRFRWREYRAMLPADWSCEIPDDVPQRLHEFFGEVQ